MAARRVLDVGTYADAGQVADLCERLPVAELLGLRWDLAAYPVTVSAGRIDNPRQFSRPQLLGIILASRPHLVLLCDNAQCIATVGDDRWLATAAHTIRGL